MFPPHSAAGEELASPQRCLPGGLAGGLSCLDAPGRTEGGRPGITSGKGHRDEGGTGGGDGDEKQGRVKGEGGKSKRQGPSTLFSQ